MRKAFTRSILAFSLLSAPSTILGMLYWLNLLGVDFSSIDFNASPPFLFMNYTIAICIAKFVFDAES
jgi:hypothetical protein